MSLYVPKKNAMTALDYINGFDTSLVPKGRKSARSRSRFMTEMFQKDELDDYMIENITKIHVIVMPEMQCFDWIYIKSNFIEKLQQLLTHLNIQYLSIHMQSAAMPKMTKIYKKFKNVGKFEEITGDSPLLVSPATIVISETNELSLKAEFNFKDIKRRPIIVTMPRGNQEIFVSKYETKPEDFEEKFASKNAKLSKPDKENFIQRQFYNNPNIFIPTFELCPILPSIGKNRSVLSIFGIKKFNPTPSICNFSSIGSETKKSREELLEQQPLRKFVTLSERSSEKYKNKNIYILATFAEENDFRKQSGLKINTDMKANDAVKKLFEVNRLTNENFKQYCYQIPGTNEIILGDYPLSDFLYVQMFLDSESVALSLTCCSIKRLQKSLKHYQGKLTKIAKEMHKHVNKSSRHKRSSSTTEQLELTSQSSELFTLSEDVFKLRYGDEMIMEKPRILKSVNHYKLTKKFQFSLDSLIINEKRTNLFEEHQDKTLTKLTFESLYLKMYLMAGTRIVRNNDVYVRKVKLDVPNTQKKKKQIIFGKNFDFTFEISQLPRYARICFAIYQKQDAKTVQIAFGSASIFDRNDQLIGGRINLGLAETDTFLPAPNNEKKPAFLISFRLPIFPVPVYYQLKHFTQSTSKLQPLNDEEQLFIEKMINFSPLKDLDTVSKVNYKQFLHDHRWRLTKYPELLPFVLKSIDFSNIDDVSELPALLDNWERFKGPYILSILGGSYMEPSIRKYIVEELDKWSDSDLSLFILQLIQALQYEHEDDSPLALFLFKRALLEPKYFGMHYFWQLLSLRGEPTFAERVQNLIFPFIAYSDDFDSSRYMLSFDFTRWQLQLCIDYFDAPKTDETKANFMGEMEKINRKMADANPYQLPIDPKTIVSSIIIDKCKIMDSKKRPILIAFKSADPWNKNENNEDVIIRTMIKKDDDLRQDQLVMQMLSFMDNLWKNEGLNLRLSLYKVMPTGDKEGYIEIVPDSVTIKEIQKSYTSNIGLLNNQEYMVKWFTSLFQKYGIKWSPNDKKAVNPEQIENYIYSLAGYCVATYLLGIGDRHCSNMMIKEDGHFFHIDFGHFLGNFKSKKLGIVKFERENQNFYISYAMINVLGGYKHPNYKKFSELCGRAYNIIRHKYKLIIYILQMMVGIGIPELKEDKDIEYFETKLNLKMSDQEASEHFDKLLRTLPGNLSQKINDVAHASQH